MEVTEVPVEPQARVVPMTPHRRTHQRQRQRLLISNSGASPWTFVFFVWGPCPLLQTPPFS